MIFFSLRLQVAMRVGVSSDQVKNVIIWGNHSSTQYPDVHHCKVNSHGKEMAAFEAVNDDAWLKGDFISVNKAPSPTPILMSQEQREILIEGTIFGIFP